MNMVIDSGASCNIVNKTVVDKIKNVKVVNSNETLYAFGAKHPLDTAGMCRAAVKHAEAITQVDTDFIVTTTSSSASLLGWKTAMKMVYCTSDH